MWAGLMYFNRISLWTEMPIFKSLSIKFFKFSRDYLQWSQEGEDTPFKPCMSISYTTVVVKRSREFTNIWRGTFIQSVVLLSGESKLARMWLQSYLKCKVSKNKFYYQRIVWKVLPKLSRPFILTCSYWVSSNFGNISKLDIWDFVLHHEIIHLFDTET